MVLQFDLSRDVNGAARDVQAAINAARSQLPANLPSNPAYRKINPADSPILILALTSDTMSVPQLYDACDSILAQKIAQVDGVGQTFCGGSAKPAVRIEANPTQLAHYGVGLEALRAAIGTVNVNQPKGYLQDDERRWSVSTTDQLFGAAAYAPLIVATDRGPVSSAAAKSGLPASVASAVDNNPAAATSTGNGSSATAAATGSGSATAMSAPAAQAIGAAAAHGIVRIRDVAQVVDSVENIQRYRHVQWQAGDSGDRLQDFDGERDSDSGQREEDAADAAGVDSAGDPGACGAGQNDDDSRVGERRDADAGDLDPAGDPGGVPVPARGAVDADSERSLFR